jgi:hypothetical protein
MRNLIFIVVLLSLANLTCTKVDYYLLDQINKYSIDKLPNSYNVKLGDTLDFTDSSYVNVQSYRLDNNYYNTSHGYIAYKSGNLPLVFYDRRNKSKSSTVTVAQSQIRFASDNQIVFTGALNYSANILLYSSVAESSLADEFSLNFNNFIFTMNLNMQIRESATPQAQYKCYSTYYNSVQYDYPRISYLTLTHPTLGTFVMVPKSTSYVRFMKYSSRKYVIDINNVELHNNASGTSIFVNANYMN